MNIMYTTKLESDWRNLFINMFKLVRYSYYYLLFFLFTDIFSLVYLSILNKPYIVSYIRHNTHLLASITKIYQKYIKILCLILSSTFLGQNNVGLPLPVFPPIFPSNMLIKVVSNQEVKKDRKKTRMAVTPPTRPKL